MLFDRESAYDKYRGAVIDAANLDDIMLYYVHKNEMGWRQ